MRTQDFQDSVAQICKERNDEWSEIVLDRLEYAQELHATDAVYHQSCSVNFHTGKQVPRQHCSDNSTDKGSKCPRQGRPVNFAKAAAFPRFAQFLEENDKEQITITDLINKMQDYLEGSKEQAYSAVYMKAKLQEHFGDKIVVINLHKKANVVPFKRTVNRIWSSFLSFCGCSLRSSLLATMLICSLLRLDKPLSKQQDQESFWHLYSLALASTCITILHLSSILTLFTHMASVLLIQQSRSTNKVQQQCKGQTYQAIHQAVLYNMSLTMLNIIQELWMEREHFMGWVSLLPSHLVLKQANQSQIKLLVQRK